VIGGLGSAVCEVVSGVCPVPVLRLGLNDVFGQSGSAEELMVHYGLTPEGAAELGRRAVAQKRGVAAAPAPVPAARVPA